MNCRVAPAPQKIVVASERATVCVAPQPGVASHEVAQSARGWMLPRRYRAPLSSTPRLKMALAAWIANSTHKEASNTRGASGAGSPWSGAFQPERTDQEAAEAGAHQHGAHHGHFQPAIGEHQALGRQHFSDQPVLGWRIGGRTEADQANASTGAAPMSIAITPAS